MLNPEQLKEAARLIFNSPQTKPFLEYLKEERERCRDLLETSQHNADALRTLQGESQAYKRLLETLEQLAK